MIVESTNEFTYERHDKILKTYYFTFDKKYKRSIKLSNGVNKYFSL